MNELSCKDIGIRKVEFVARIKFLSLPSICLIEGVYFDLVLALDI